MEKLDLNKGLKYDVGDNIIDKIVFISNSFELEGIINDGNSFQTFLQKFSQKNNFLSEDIKAVEFKNNKVIIYTKDGKNYNFDFSEYKKEVVRETVGDIDIKALEEKTEIIEIAMESIFFDNDGIFDELNLNDKVDLKRVEDLLKKGRLPPVKGKTIQETLSLLKPFEGKNLLELRKEIDLAEESLKKYYGIIGETKKSVSILERQISHYAGIGDRYEGGARLFAMNSQELDQKTTEIVNQKTVSELIEYIRYLNNQIDSNGKIDDMAKAMNQGVIENIVSKTFEKIKSTKASNREVINFVQVITGRKLTQNQNGKISEKNLKVGIFSDFKQTEIANKALVYLLYDRGIIEKISEKQKPKLEVKVFKGKENQTVGSILDESLEKFEKIGIEKEIFLQNLDTSKLDKNEKISDLSFNEILLLSSIYSISQDIEKNISGLKGKTPEQIISFLQEKNNESLKENFKQVNESLEKNFGATLFDWNGKNGKDFGLSGEEAEIFDLYGEINGRGLFNLADNNWFAETFLNSQTGVVMAVGMLTAMVVLSPAVMAAGGVGLLAAGAKIGLTTTIASQLMDKKGYANVKEAAAGVAIQGSIDIASSAIFTGISGKVVSGLAPRFSPKLGNSLKSGNITPKVSGQIDDFLEHGGRELGKNSILKGPERFWKPKLQATVDEIKIFKDSGFKGHISEKSIKYLQKYNAFNGLKGDIIDGGIGILDGIVSSILWQGYGHQKLNSFFYENHYNPDDGETFESVRTDKKNTFSSQEDFKTSALQVRQNMEKNILKNSDLTESYNGLSEEEKKELSFMLAYLIRRNNFIS